MRKAGNPMKTPICRTALAAVLLLLGMKGSFSAEKKLLASGEFGLTLGAGFSSARGSSVQRSAWTSGTLAGAFLENAFSVESRAALAIGGFYIYPLGRRLGLEAGFGYLKSPLSARTAFTRNGVPSAGTRTLSVNPNPSEVTSVPFYVNLAARWNGPKTAFTLSAGPVLLLHSILVEAAAGILSADGGIPAAFRVPAGIADQTWVALGANAGARFDVRVGRLFALTVDLRYFLSPVREFGWTWTAGTAAGIDAPASRAPFDEASAAAAARATPPLSLNPSFFQVSAGLKLILK